MLLKKRRFPNSARASVLLGFLAVASGSAPSLAQDAGAGLVQRLQALEAKVAALEERRFESGALQIYSGQIPEMLNAKCEKDLYRGIVNQRVTFSKPFPRPPKVLLALDSFAMGSESLGSQSANPQKRINEKWKLLNLAVLSVDQEGFNYRFATYCEGMLAVASGSWLALLEE